jgi:hypothetical protein
MIHVTELAELSTNLTTDTHQSFGLMPSLSAKACRRRLQAGINGHQRSDSAIPGVKAHGKADGRPIRRVHRGGEHLITPGASCRGTRIFTGKGVEKHIAGSPG